MASNRIPRNLKQLIPLGEEAAKGAQSHGLAVGLALNTAAKIRADLTRLVGDQTVVPPVVGSVAIYNRAKAAKVRATKDRNAAVQRGRDFISATIGALSPRLGKRWSSDWNAVGFTDGSLALPENPLPTVHSIKSYLLAHPSHEVVSPDGKVDVSATAAAARQAEITATRSAANTSETALATAQDAMEADRLAFYKRMTGLRSELKQLLAGDDPAWYAFGFSRPADARPPGAIATLSLAPGGSGMLIATWSRSVRAERFRVFKKAIGTDPEPVQIASDVEGRTFAILGLPSGATVEVFIVPANATGDGPPSPMVAAVVP